MENFCRFYTCAGITFRVESDLPITDTTFTPAINRFQVDQPGNDIVSISLHFSLPDLSHTALGNEVYRKAPWAIYKSASTWHYTVIPPNTSDKSVYKVAVFNNDYSDGHIFNRDKEGYIIGSWNSITMLPTDQILISQLLSARDGLYLHSAGAILDNKGFLFVGHSEAGKSTITKLLMDYSSDSNKTAEFQVEILCDDRNIVRRVDNEWIVYGSWSHGDVPVVSPSSSKLKAICFIEKSDHNTIIKMDNQKAIRHLLMSYVIKALVTTDWWNDTLDCIEKLAQEVPCYVVHFDKSGKILPEIAQLLKNKDL